MSVFIRYKLLKNMRSLGNSVWIGLFFLKWARLGNTSDEEIDTYLMKTCVRYNNGFFVKFCLACCVCS